MRVRAALIFAQYYWLSQLRNESNLIKNDLLIAGALNSLLNDAGLNQDIFRSWEFIALSDSKSFDKLCIGKWEAILY